MANKKGSRQLNLTKRIKLETLLANGNKVTEIAFILGVHRSTIYNEIKRGTYIHLNSEYIEEKRYSADLAQIYCDQNLKMRGTGLKIGNDIKLADYIEERIVDDGLSPDAVLGEIEAKGMWDEFSTRICTTTLYSYIDKGIFLRLTNKELPVKRKEKRKYKKLQRVQKRDIPGQSIENRPERINKRGEFGHWEMDSVVGKKGSKNTLLVLTERKTRDEIIFKLPDRTARAVVDVIDSLERQWGEMFKTVFKSITVDNGREFAYCEELENSVLGEEKRTNLYYCHPYSSWERGTNEVTNKMVRRHVPKGTSFDDKTDEEIAEIESWINNYPRRIFGYRTSAELFNEELEKLKNKCEKEAV